MKANYSDHLELAVAEILERHNIEFVHESQNNGSNIDFYLPDYDVYIEVKQYHSDRVINQLNKRDNIILIQGIGSIKMIERLLLISANAPANGVNG